MRVYVVTDQFCTDGECGFIIGIFDEYELAINARIKYAEHYKDNPVWKPDVHLETIDIEINEYRG